MTCKTNNMYYTCNSNWIERLIAKAIMSIVFVLIAMCLPNILAAQSKGIEQKIAAVPFTGTVDVAAPNQSIRLQQTTPNLSSAVAYPSSQQNTQTSKNISNIITFEILETSPKFIPQDFTASATVLIEYGHSAAGPLESHTQLFEVTYNKADGAKYNAKNYFSLNGAEYVKISLVAINAPVISGLDTRDVLMLKNEMVITRYFELPASVPPPASFNFTTPADPVPDHLKVNWAWPVNTGHNGTQLEWNWIENETEDNYKTNGVIDYNLVFKNATRVDLPYDSISYNIPLLYDGIGKIYYRIRAANFKENGGRSDGPWNVGTVYSFNGHNNDLNWQSTTTFAEDGKRKSVIQYYDGSLRGRQTVTKDNSTNTVVTAESFYDSEGRPAIQILPTPGISNIIQYQAGLNKFNTQLPNQDPAEIFDMQPINTPGSLTEPLSTASGSSNYYSPQNSLANTGINKNIPNAEGYPYTVTRYTPDATGRILSQSGVGAAHKMSSGHETKYYYGGAAQEELDGLFGTEVGNFTHYSKNMVQDANKQMSISYVDMHGRTIATALAGDAPACVEPLDKNNPANYPGQAGTLITRNLLDNTTNIVRDNTIESINSILVPAITNYTFNYNLNPQTLQLANCPDSTPLNLCYECKYDLEIAIVDESGELDAPVMVRKYTNIDINQNLSDDCGTPQLPMMVVPGNDALPSDINGYQITFTKQLPIGSYAIRKTLTVNEASYQTYLDIYKAKALCKSEKQIIDSIYSVLLSTSNCDSVPMTCQSCTTALGTFEQFKAAYLTAMGLNPNDPISSELLAQIQAAYSQEQENCARLCNTTSQSLPTLRQMMVQDMIPFSGQYAVENANDHIPETDPPSTPPSLPTTMYNKYNIFTGSILNERPFYKHPKIDNGVTTVNIVNAYYYDENGAIDPIAHPEPFQLPINYANNIYLNGLSPVDYKDIFKFNWANQLLVKHPEYERLRFAEINLGTSYNYIGNFTQTNSWQTANTNNYLTPLTSDPFISTAGNTSIYATNISSRMNNYQNSGLSIWQIAYGDVRCKSIVDNAARQACYQAAPTTPPPYSGFTSEENDQAWQMFRGLYANLRNSMVDSFIVVNKPLPNSDEDDLLAQKYRLWFVRSNYQQANQSGMPWWPPTGTQGQGPTGGNPTSTTTPASRCSSYVNMWRNRLLECAALENHVNKETILTTITNRMIAVCVNGSNAANAYGSSTVAPTTPPSVTDRSFEQIIKEVFIANGIMNANGIYNDNYCNPFVIDWPKPYGKGPRMTGNETTNQLDSCNCTQYRKIKTEAIAANVNVNSLPAFNVYLLQQHGDTLTQIMFDALRTKCGDPSPACNCKDLNKTIDLYHIQYPNGGLDSCGSTLPVDLIVNSRTGNTPAEYIASNSITFNPGFESGVNDQFVAYIDSTGGCDSVGMCHIRFTNFFNTKYGYNPPLTWAQIDSIYIANCGHSPYVCGYKDYGCTELQKVVCNYLGLELAPQFGKNANSNAQGNCKLAFANYFNNYYHNIPPLTWEEIVQIYVSNECETEANLDYYICGISGPSSPPYANPPYCGAPLPPLNCTDSIPYVLPQPVPLPPFLKCGYIRNPRCVSCAGLSVLTGEYKTIFTTPPSEAPIFTGSNLTPEQLQHNMNYARFLNYRLGYQFGWMEYAQAAAAATPACNLPNYPNNTNANQNVICGDAKPLTDTTIIQVDSPCTRLYTMAINMGQEIYRIRLQTKLAEFEAAYRAKCMQVKNTETFTVQYQTSEYHYTLYYYDQAGNLVKTVPPKGVRPDFSTTYTNTVKANRAAGIDNPRPHEYITQYRYNSLNQVVAQNTPDANTSKFWYDALGRLVVSQNAQQAIDNKYSYTLYDNLGRIKEVGQKPQTTVMTQTISQDNLALNNWIYGGGGNKEQVTITTYDIKADNVNPVPLDQQNLRNRVSYVQVFDVLALDPADLFDHHAATYYTYDIHGNVDKLLQDYKGIPEMDENNGNRFKTTQYSYDLISGKVNMVAYQPSEADAFYHRYQYDAENRLTEVYTSRDKLVWERDAKYDYYKHGPLARTELGQLRVQGTDYAYTIQGWLKGINNTSLNPTLDVFGDGSNTSTVAKDALSFALHYFDETVSSNTYVDYKPIGSPANPYNMFAQVPSNIGGIVGGLYNGNIRAMAVNNAGLLKANASTNNTMPLFYAYKYDQLNRIRAMQTYKGLNATTNVWTPVAMADYNEAITYDPNGNIYTYLRNGAPTAGTPQAMDDMGYEYITNTNKLKRVTDNPSYSGNYPNDIDNQTNANNYTYDAIGNLTADATEGIDNITWNVYGKIKSITKANNSTITYTYDASGNRISKRVAPDPTTIDPIKTTIYVRDASGNVMSVYEHEGLESSIAQTEVHLYGSSRLGILNKLTVPVENIALMGDFGAAKLSTFTRAEKLFELSNHLGNVLVTISDKKIAVANPNNANQILYYTADVITAGDYAPFGMGLVGRKFSSGNYRYGFNGKENDNSTGEGNLDFGARIMDVRVGRWLSVDPLQRKYPSESPYIFGGNSPISTIDVEGKYKYVVHLIYDYQTGKLSLFRIVKEAGLKSKTVTESKQACGNCGSFVVDRNYWQDYMTFNFTVINQPAADKCTVIFEAPDVLIGNVKDITDNSEWFDNWYNENLYDSDRGGIMWTTSETQGFQGAGVWGSPDAMSNIDNFTKLKESYENAGIIQLPPDKIIDFAEKIIKAIDYVDGKEPPSGYTDQANKPIDNMEAALRIIEKIAPKETPQNFNSVSEAKDYFNKKNQEPSKITHCRYCNVNYDPKNLRESPLPAKDTSDYHEKKN